MAYYKIVNNKAQVGNKPHGADWIEYTVGSEPQELVDGLAYRTDDELEDEAKQAKLKSLSEITVITSEVTHDVIHPEVPEVTHDVIHPEVPEVTHEEEDIGSEPLTYTTVIDTPYEASYTETIVDSPFEPSYTETIVDSGGNEFDGDDVARESMLSAIQASTYLGLVKHNWKLANNQWVLVGIDELQEAHAKSIQAKGAILGS